jgi:DNA-directed RNA polymerase subunit E'/Rpb7
MSQSTTTTAPKFTFVKGQIVTGTYKKALADGVLVTVKSHIGNVTEQGVIEMLPTPVAIPGAPVGKQHVRQLPFATISERDAMLAEMQKMDGEGILKDADEVTLVICDEPGTDRQGRPTIPLSEQAFDARQQLAAIQVGQVLDAEVVRTVAFGAFLKVTSYNEGLLHIKQMTDRLDGLQQGQVLKVKVTAKQFVPGKGTQFELSQKALTGRQDPPRKARPSADELRQQEADAKQAMEKAFNGTFSAGSVHTGTVVGRNDGGFVISFGPFSGILPDSQLGKAAAGSIKVKGRTKVRVVEIKDGTLMLSRQGM